MKRFTFVVLFCLINSWLFAFQPKIMYVLFQPSPQNSYLRILLLEDNAKFKYYELLMSNNPFLNVTITDSISGTWDSDDKHIYLFSNYYCELEDENLKRIQEVLMCNRFICDYLCLTIIDDCTLSIPNLYHQFRCVELLNDSNDFKQLDFIFRKILLIDY